MAKTPAEKMKTYRQKLKENGGKKFNLTLPPDKARTIEMIGEQCYPNLDFNEVVREMLGIVIEKNLDLVKEQLKLKNEFGADDATIQDYLAFEVQKFKTTKAEHFLKIVENFDNQEGIQS